MTFKDRFKERVMKQGEKLENRFRDRPMARERYETLMTIIGAVILAYLVFSLMCVIKVIGEWW